MKSDSIAAVNCLSVGDWPRFISAKKMFFPFSLGGKNLHDGDGVDTFLGKNWISWGIPRGSVGNFVQRWNTFVHASVDMQTR